MNKRFFLLISLVTILSYKVPAEPVDSTIESVLVEMEEPFDLDAYYEELVTKYGGEDYKHYQAVRERIVGDEARHAEERAKRKNQQMIALILSLIVALSPTIFILKQVITGELQPANATAVLRTVGVLLLGGIVLFGINYAWLWSMFSGQDTIIRILLGLFLLAFVIYALYTLNKSKHSSK